MTFRPANILSDAPRPDPPAHPFAPALDSPSQARKHHVALATRDGVPTRAESESPAPKASAPRRSKPSTALSPELVESARAVLTEVARNALAAAPEAPVPLRAGIPLGFVRSQLFGVHERCDENLSSKVLAVDDRIKIAYHGPALNQTHARLWQALVSLASAGSGGSKTMTATRPEILRAMGHRDTSCSSGVWLVARLEELARAQVNMKTDRMEYFGNLIYEYCYDNVSKTVQVNFNSRLAILLSDQTVDIYLHRKSSLGRNQLAMWLHDFVASQTNDARKQFPIKVQRLRDLCGTKDDLREFRRNLKVAANLLATKGDQPLLKSWALNERDEFVYRKVDTHVTLKPQEARDRETGNTYQERAAAAARARRSTLVL